MPKRPSPSPRPKPAPHKFSHYTAAQATAIRRTLKRRWHEADWQRALAYITGRVQQALARTAFRESHPTRRSRQHAIQQLETLDHALNLTPVVYSNLQAIIDVLPGAHGHRFVPALVQEAIALQLAKWKAETKPVPRMTILANVQAINPQVATVLQRAHALHPTFKPPADFPRGRPKHDVAHDCIVALCLFYWDAMAEEPTVYAYDGQRRRTVESDRYTGNAFYDFAQAVLRPTNLIDEAWLGSAIFDGYQEYQTLRRWVKSQPATSNKKSYRKSVDFLTY